MSNYKVYELSIIKYINNEFLYILQSYKLSKRNWWISNVQSILETKDKYELKLKLDLLGLSFLNITSDSKYNTVFKPPVKSVHNFKLKSSYENQR